MISFLIGFYFAFAQQVYNTYKIEEYYNDRKKKLEYDYKLRCGKDL
jgi:hypothetical protein